MKRETIFIFLLVGSGLCVSNPFFYEENYVILGEGMVSEIPLVLTDRALIEQQYYVNLMPDITVNGKKLNLVGFVLLPAGEDQTFKPSNSYYMKTLNDIDGYEISNELRIYENRIESTVSFSNRNSEAASVVMSNNFSAVRNFTVFDPSQYTKQPTDYIVLMPPEEEGASLGVIYPGVDLTTERASFQRIPFHEVSVRNTDVVRGGTFAYTMILYPMNLQREKELIYPLELSDNIRQKTFRIKGTLETFNSLEDAEMKLFGDAKGLDGSQMHKVDFNANNRDFISAAAGYDKACETIGEVCRVFVGRKDGKYYAWGERYDGGQWLKNSLHGMLPDYTETVYEEPTLKLVRISVTKEKMQAYYEATSFLLDLNKNETLMYFALVFVAGIVAIAIIHVKAKTMMKKTSKVSIRPKTEIEGKYVVLKEKSFDDPLLSELMRIVKESGGVVSVKAIESATKYSPELISFGIQYLADEGVISKDIPVPAGSSSLGKKLGLGKKKESPLTGLKRLGKSLRGQKRN